jgi:hypothetical protein
MVSAGDVNNDGNPDIVVGAHYAAGGTGEVYVFLSDPAFDDTPPVCTGFHVNTGEPYFLPGETKLRDSTAAEYVKGSKTRILTNSGKGVFTNSTASLFPATKTGDDWGGTTLALGDLDGDATDDLVVSTGRAVYSKDGATKTYLSSTRIFLGGASGFTEKTSTFLPSVPTDGKGETWKASDVALADVDGDGKVELFLLTREKLQTGDGQVSSLRWIANQGIEPFTNATAEGLPDPAVRPDYYLGDVLLLGDVDGDDDKDLIVSTSLAGYLGTANHPTRLLEFR